MGFGGPAEGWEPWPWEAGGFLGKRWGSLQWYFLPFAQEHVLLFPFFTEIYHDIFQLFKPPILQFASENVFMFPFVVIFPVDLSNLP